MVVIPAYHPAFILRQNLRFSGLVELAFLRAVEAIKGKVPSWTEEEFILPRVTVEQVEETLASMHGKKVAFDVETDGRHPLECSLRCIAFYDGKRGITVPLLFRDGSREDVQVRTKKGKLRTESHAIWTPYFGGEAAKRVRAAIKKLLLSKGTLLITQNGQFDRVVVKSQLGIDAPSGFDTMLAHHLVAPYLPHDLGFLGALYTDVPFYKSTSTGESWASDSDEELWRYNLRDVKVTWLVARKLEKELREVPQNTTLFEHDTWQERECQRWKEVGVELDPYALAFFRQHYHTISAKALALMKALVVRRVEKDADPFADKEKEREGMLQALLEKLQEKADEEGLDEDGNPVELFNPASLRQLRLLLGGLGVPLEERTATGELSTAKEFLTGARKELLAAKVKPTDDRIAFLDYLFAWRESTKVDSTYLRPEVLKDGRVHPTFSVHVTPTGRLCLADWTPVRVQGRGMVAVKDVRIGDKVWTHRGRWRRVTAVYFNGTRDVVDMHLQNGQVLTSTTDHRFLLDSGEWATVGGLRERLEEVARLEIESGSRGGSVPKPRLAYAGGHREGVGNDVRHRHCGTAYGASPRGPARLGATSVLGIEDRREEPHAGEEGNEAPSLEGALRGWEGVPHHPLEGSEDLRSSRCDVEGPEALEAPTGDGGSPRRRGPEEQRAGQPRTAHGAGAPTSSLSAGEGLDGCRVEAVVSRGRAATVDLGVEEDHSFEVAGGVFSHNSSQRPNFQNQPADIRGMFVARKDHVLVSMDWDALEMRLGAFNSEDPAYIEAFLAYDAKRGPKPHIVNMGVIFNVPATPEYADQHPHLYRAAKVFAYAGAYGATDMTMYEQMREEMPDLQFDVFKAAVSNYKTRYARLFEFQNQVVMQGTREGYLDSGLLQRRTYFFEQAIGSKSPEASAMQNFPYQATGADVVSEANRRIMEKLVIPWRKTRLKPGEALEQLAQVHDELLFEVPERLKTEFIVELKKLAEQPPKTKPHWKLPVDIKAKRRWKAVQTRCKTCRDLVDVEMVKPHVWEGVCDKKHVTRIEVQA